MGGIVRGLGETLGLVKSKPEEVAPEFGEELFQRNMQGFDELGQDPETKKRRAMIEKAIADQLGGLEDNSAGRKADYMEDMGRSFATDTQNLARAKGGTGNLASALRPSGEMYDAQARATSRGLNDLYSQATDDISKLGGASQDLYQQDYQRAAGKSGVLAGETQSRRNQANTNADNRWNATQARNKALSGTVSQLQKNAASAVGGMSGGG